MTDEIVALLRCPFTGQRLRIDPAHDLLRSEDGRYAYNIAGNAADLMFPVREGPAAEEGVATDGFLSTVPAHDSSEGRQFHDLIFSDPSCKGLYNDFASLPPIVESGHYRRIELLRSLRLPDLAGATAVDVGTGPWGFAAIIPELRKARRWVGLDVSFEALKQADQALPAPEQHVGYVTSDGAAFPLANGAADVVFAGEVIEHVREPELFLQECARVLKPGGDLILSTPNRDALLYKINGQHYGVGPEHIALLNYPEIVELAGRLFDIVRVYGYETSLSPATDERLRDRSLLELVQQRAAFSPELASGVLLHMKQNPARQQANTTNWRLTDIMWNDSAVAVTGELIPMVLAGMMTGGRLAAGSSLRLCVPGRKIIFLFWSHDWSGYASLNVNGRIEHHDLYSFAGGFRRIEVPGSAEPGEVNEVVISSPGHRSAHSHSDEIILFKVIGVETELARPAAR
jgi:SAM-dependent methyltransferase